MVTLERALRGYAPISATIVSYEYKLVWLSVSNITILNEYQIWINVTAQTHYTPIEITLKYTIGVPFEKIADADSINMVQQYPTSRGGMLYFSGFNEIYLSMTQPAYNNYVLAPLSNDR